MRSVEVIDLLTDIGVPITYRKLDYWVRLGLLAPLHEHGVREFRATDLEVLYAIAQLYAMGADRDHVRAAATEVSHRPVQPNPRHHEVLVLSHDLTIVLRVLVRQLVDMPEGRFWKACWVVPLRSFADTDR